jgi:hypothetical protein
MIVPWNTASLGDALKFDRRLQHHAFVELLDKIALNFLPRRLARRIPIATRLRQRGAALGKLGRRSNADWPFFVGNADAIEQLTRALGFRFLRDPRTGSLAHAAVVFVLTPDGRISR